VKILYDPEVDAMYIEFCELQPGAAEMRELSEDINVNYGPGGKPAGIEILNASVIFGQELHKVVVEVSPARRVAKTG